LDFIYQWLLVAAIPATKWPFVLSELVLVTYYGGWVELQEASNDSIQPGP
jgi:hypothetical protein